jgi:molybdate transport system substrate-binding protein
MKTGLVTAVSLTLALSVAPATAAEGQTLKIHAAAALKIALTEIATEYEAETGNTVDVVFDTAGASERNFLADQGAELLITTPERIERAQSEGELIGGTTIVLGVTVAGIAVPPGSEKPDISSSENLRAALLAADRIAFSDPSRGATVGNHFMYVIESLGIKDEVMAKAALAENGVETMRLVLEEGVDIGITQSAEIIQANRDALAGPFPDEFELATAYALWHGDEISQAAEDIVERLTSSDGMEKIAAEGLSPPREN